MLLRCFRVDRIYLAITQYVTKAMGDQFVTPPVIHFEAIWEQSTPLSPIIFILSPGSDPTTDLLKLAERSEFGVGKVKLLAMGQGQEKVRNRGDHFPPLIDCFSNRLGSDSIDGTSRHSRSLADVAELSFARQMAVRTREASR